MPIPRAFHPLLLICLLGLPLLAAGEENVRMLYDFESEDDFKSLTGAVNGIVLEASQDRCVTSGKKCCRMIFAKGGQRDINLPADKIREWKGFDYLAIDIFSDEPDKIDVGMHFNDANAKGRDTRCSLHMDIVPGKQTFLVPINRLKRNNKEGRGWDELEAKDKIDLNALTGVKLYISTPKDRDVVLWTDSIRLLNEDALGLNIAVPLPAGALAFQFGKPKGLVGFTAVAADMAFDGTKGFAGKADLAACGKRWPDPLCGTGVYSPTGQPFSFELTLPNGEYLVWLAAGQVLRQDLKSPRFLLKVGDQVIYDETPALADYFSKKYLFRFMDTVYSERENAQWLDFISRMYPVYQTKMVVSGGKLAVSLCNYQLSSLIVAPVKEQAAFDAMTKAIATDRIKVFSATEKTFNRTELKRAAADGDCVAFIPDEAESVGPSTTPGKADREGKAFDLAASPDQNLSFRVAVAAFADLGECQVKISALAGPSEIPAKAIRVFHQDFRRVGIDVVEAGLMPTDRAPLEKGITRCFWFWVRVPADAKPGNYTGTVTVVPGKGAAKVLPLKLTVHPLRLEQVLPYSFGLWYSAEQTPDPAQRRRIIKEQLEFMRAIGLTATTIDAPNRDGDIDPFLIDLLKEVGMGRHPAQMSITYGLTMARTIARTMLGAKIDRNPGCEFDNPEFKGQFMAAARKLAENLGKYGLPITVQTIDEPREVPQPWNRNLEQTDLYGDWFKEAGITNTFVDPMADENRGKDYTPLIDHHDIIGTHAGAQSQKLMAQTIEKKKVLWLYNTGMDRLSWGFYNWRVGSTGRWEWHWRHISGDGADNGYLNDEWFNPFTKYNQVPVPAAPYATHPGAMVFTSSLMTAMEGITDSAYICTLLKAMEAAKAKPDKAAALAQAQAFFHELRQEIPFLPGVKGIASAADGALVGQGLTTPVAARCEAWRRKAISLLLKLQP